MPYPDLTEALQARILADLKAGKVGPAPPNRLDPGESHRVGALEAHIATLEEAMAKAETLGEQRRQEAETAFKRVEVLEAQIATLEEAVGKAEALGEQRRQEVATEVKRTKPWRPRSLRWRMLWRKPRLWASSGVSKPRQRSSVPMILLPSSSR